MINGQFSNYCPLLGVVNSRGRLIMYITPKGAIAERSDHINPKPWSVGWGLKALRARGVRIRIQLRLESVGFRGPGSGFRVRLSEFWVEVDLP